MEKVNFDGDDIYLKKGIGGWRIAYPIKTEGKINHKNLWLGGGWFNLFKTFLVILAIVILSLAYSHDLKACSEVANYVAENPCDWCNAVMKVKQDNEKYFDDMKINITLVEELIKE